MKLLSATKIDNFDIKERSIHPNFFYERHNNVETATASRLKFCSERNKSWLDQYRMLKAPSNKTNLNTAKNEPIHSLYRCSDIFRIDYDIPHDEKKLVRDTHYGQESSFTVYSWLILYQIIKNHHFSFADIDPEEVVKLGFSIFPNMRTALHFIAFAMVEGSAEETNALFNAID